MIRVYVEGTSPLADTIAAAIVSQPDMTLADDSTATGWIRGSALSSDAKIGGPVIVEFGAVNERRVGDERRTYRNRIPPALVIGVRRALRACGPLRFAHLTVLAPAGTPFAASAGPIDAIVIEDATFTEELTATTGGEITAQLARVSHTRCWLIACSVGLETPALPQAILSAFETASRVLLLPERPPFENTTAMLELFRDLGRPGGRFFESVVFQHTLAVDATGRLRFWVAVHEAAVVPETLDSLRLLASEKMQCSDDGLGLIDRLDG